MPRKQHRDRRTAPTQAPVQSTAAQAAVQASSAPVQTPVQASAAPTQAAAQTSAAPTQTAAGSGGWTKKVWKGGAEDVISDFNAAKDVGNAVTNFTVADDSKAANGLAVANGALDMATGAYSTVQNLKKKEYLSAAESGAGALSAVAGTTKGIAGLAGGKGAANVAGGVQGSLDMLGGGLGAAGAVRDLWRTKGKQNQTSNRVAGGAKLLSGLGKTASGLFGLLSSIPGVGKWAAMAGKITSAVTAGLGVIGRVTDRLKTEDPPAGQAAGGAGGGVTQPVGQQEVAAAEKQTDSTDKDSDGTDKDKEKVKDDVEAAKALDKSDIDKLTQAAVKSTGDNKTGELPKSLPKEEVAKMAQKVAKRETSSPKRKEERVVRSRRRHR